MAVKLEKVTSYDVSGDNSSFGLVGLPSGVDSALLARQLQLLGIERVVANSANKGRTLFAQEMAQVAEVPYYHANLVGRVKRS